MEKVTFDNLPTAVNELLRLIQIILSLIQGNNKSQDQDVLFTIEQLIDYLPEHPARQTVYGWVNMRIVPYEKHGKRLYFRKSDIDAWLNNGRKIK